MARGFSFPGSLLLCLLALSGCFTQNETPAQLSDDLVGVWLRPIEGLPGREGYQFESSGAVRFVNMFTIEGVRWEMLTDNTVRVWSATERYPEPESVDLEVVAVTDSELRLRRASSPDSGVQIYTRAPDSWTGRWTAENGDFVDIVASELADQWRVSIDRGQGVEFEVGRRVGVEMIIGVGLGTSRLKRPGAGCLQWAGRGEFCRRLPDLAQQ